MPSLLTERQLPTIELEKALEAYDLAKVMSGAATELQLELDLNFEFGFKRDPTFGSRWIPPKANGFFSKSGGDYISFVAEEPRNANSASRPRYQIINFVRVVGKDLTDEYVDRAEKAAKAVQESCEKYMQIKERASRK